MVDGPEDKGPRYRLVMFVALAAIVGPGFFLLNWIGDNGVNNLFRQLVGLDAPRPRVTRTVTPAASIVAAATPATANSPTVTVPPIPSATATVPLPTATQVVVPATARPATATPTRAVAPPTVSPTAAPTFTPPPPTASPRPPSATATQRPAPTPTLKPSYLGYGTAVPAYGGAAVIREEPTTEAEALGSIPLDGRVLVIRLVEGEAIDPVEPRWWEVDYEGVRGFVYYKLIVLD